MEKPGTALVENEHMYQGRSLRQIQNNEVEMELVAEIGVCLAAIFFLYQGAIWLWHQVAAFIH